MQTKIHKQPNLSEIPRAQPRTLTHALSDFAKLHDRNVAIALAYLSGHHTMAAIAEHFGVHYTTVSRLVKRHEESQERGK